MHFFALGSIGVHWTVLAGVIFLEWPVAFFLGLQLGVLVLLLLLLGMFENRVA